jgi:hypothetical protein
MARITNQFRLGFRLGRLKGRVEASMDAAHVWNGSVNSLSEVISQGSTNIDALINDARKDYDDALFEQQLKDEEIETYPASRADRKALRRAKRAWHNQQDHTP